MAGLFVFIPFDAVLANMRRVAPLTWGLIVFAFLGIHAVSAAKWRLVINLAGAQLSATHALRCYGYGLFSNLFLPSLIGGDVVRVGLAFPKTNNRTGLVTGSTADRLLDVAALAAISGIGALFWTESLAPSARNALLLVVAGLAVIVVLSVWVAIAQPSSNLSGKLAEKMVPLREAIGALVGKPQWLLLAFGIAVSIQLAFVMLSAWIGTACGLELPLALWLFAWPMAKLSALLPVSQGGIGVREVALAALLAPLGASPEATVAVGLIWETVIVVGSAMAGFAAWASGIAVADYSAIHDADPSPARTHVSTWNSEDGGGADA